MKLGTLHYKDGEGSIKFKSKVDLTGPNVVMLDVLGDWIAVLTIAYDDMHAITYPKENK